MVTAYPMVSTDLRPWEERFNGVAYGYRSWPAADVQGVAERYAELLAFVLDSIEQAEADERDRQWDASRD